MQIKYPSALKCFEKITKNAKNKKIAVFLDYDGTLSPIVDQPDRAIMSDAVSMTDGPFWCMYIYDINSLVVFVFKI